MGLSDLFNWRRRDDIADDAPPADGSGQSTKALPRLLAGLSSRPQALLLDLGPVVGSNVTFFGEELGCKILVEDLAADIDRHVQEERLDHLPAFFARRITHGTASVDGILCWDLFDYLPRPAAQALAPQLARILRPQGMLLALFNSNEPAPGARPTYTKHIVVSRERIQYRPYPAAARRQRPLANRDVERLFNPLRVSEQFLLKTNIREVLLRKPAAPTPIDLPPVTR